MGYSCKKILLSCLCTIAYLCSHAQHSISADVFPSLVNRDDYFTYRIGIENPGDLQNIQPPSLKSFTIISGPSQERGVSFNNGQTRPFVSLVYVLKPRKTGKFKISPAVATMAGKTLSSNACSIVVSNSLPGNATGNSAFPGFDPLVQPVSRPDFSDYILHKGDNINDKVTKNMQLRLEVDKTTCYVGEPIVAAYRLYTRLKSESKLSQNPSFNGFSVIDMQQPGFNDYVKGKLNGREYNVYTIRKAQLYALQPGVIELEPAELDNDVQFIREEYAKKVNNAVDMFNDFAGIGFPPDAVIRQSVSLKNTPVSITVKPLPEENKPASFKGAVGSFTIAASLQKADFSTDEAGKLILVINGSGNMQLLTAPDIEWPKGIEPFEPKFSDKLSNTTVPVSGSKIFEYSFASNDSGRYVLPPVKFSYFDPATATYRTVSTDSIGFRVSKGDGHPLVLSNAGLGNEQHSFLNSIFVHRWWIIIFIGVVMITGLFMWVIRDKRPRQPTAQFEKTNEDAFIESVVEDCAINQQNVFTETANCLDQDDCYGFYTLLNSELKTWLGSKFLLDMNMINSGSIVSALDRKGVPNDIVLQLQHIMQEVERQLYTPFEKNDRMKELYSEAHDVVQQVNAGYIRTL